jgi:hypothetical protein
VRATVAVRAAVFPEIWTALQLGYTGMFWEDDTYARRQTQLFAYLTVDAKF